MSREAEIATVTSQINDLLDDLTATVESLAGILGGPKVPITRDEKADAEEGQWPATT